MARRIHCKRSRRAELSPPDLRNKQPGRTHEEDARKALMPSKPAELTDLIALLVSPHATSVTGAKYVIDGTVPTAQPDLAI